MGEEATKNVKVTPSLDAALAEVCEDREMQKGMLVAILLRYALPRTSEAIDEWKRAWKRRRSFEPLAAPEN